MKQITIDLIRHGETTLNGHLLGKTDAPLSEAGWRQLGSLIEENQVPWQKIISSPLQRCVSLADKLGQQYRLPVIIEKDFEEMDFGDWDGSLLTDLYNGTDKHRVMDFFSDPCRNTPTQGETFSEFEARVTRGWEGLNQTLMRDDIQHALVITHGGVIRVILKQILGMPADKLSQLIVPHAGITRVQRYDTYPDQLVFHGQKVGDVRQLFI